MAYKRYFYRNGKKFGPYYYKSYRDNNGKVKKKYVGLTDTDKKEEKKITPTRFFHNNSKILMFIFLFFLVASLLLGLGLFFNNSYKSNAKYTGFVSYQEEETEQVYDAGQINLEIKQPSETGNEVLDQNKNKNKIMDFNLTSGRVRLYFDLLNYSEFVENVASELTPGEIPEKTDELLSNETNEDQTLTENSSSLITGNIIKAIAGITAKVIGQTDENNTDNQTNENIQLQDVSTEIIKEKVEELNNSKIEEISNEATINAENFDIVVNESLLEEEKPEYKWGYKVKLNDLNFMAKIEVTSEQKIRIWDNYTIQIGNNLMSFQDLVNAGYTIRLEKPSLEINTLNLTKEPIEENITTEENKTTNENITSPGVINELLTNETNQTETNEIINQTIEEGRENKTETNKTIIEENETNVEEQTPTETPSETPSEEEIPSEEQTPTETPTETPSEESTSSITGSIIKAIGSLTTKAILGGQETQDLEYNNSITIYIERDFTNSTYKVGDIIELDPNLGIIKISKASHLDEDRFFLEDIYLYVNLLDNIWSNVIPKEDYVRIKFEKNLTNINDITIYAKTVNSNESAQIEVYRQDSNELLATFNNIKDAGYYKIYLTNLNDSEEQDVFDLKIKNADVMFDHIIDPTRRTLNILPSGCSSCAFTDCNLNACCNGGANYQCVDEVGSPDDDTTFLRKTYGATIPSRTDIYTHSTNLTYYNLANINNVSVIAYCVRSLGTWNLSLNVNNNWSTRYVLTASYAYYTYDATSANAWTWAQLSTFGFTLFQNAASAYNSRCSQVYLHIEYNDSVAPAVTVNSPANTTYNATGATKSINFNVTATDDPSNVSSCWYSINNGVNNYTMTQSGNSWNATNSSVGVGSYRAKFWCNDTEGNVNSSTYVDFTVNPNTIPNTPVPSLISLDPSFSNSTSYDLNCSARISDPEASSMNVTIGWYKNNVLNLTFDYNNNYVNGTMFSSILNKGNLTKNDVWKCGLRLYDGTNYSSWGNSSNLTILNSAPNYASPIIRSLNSSANSTSYDLNCSALITDPDRDSLNVTVKWYKNNVLNLTLDYNNTYANGTLFNTNLSKGNLSVNDQWKCELTLYDGQSASIDVSNTITILNTPPNTPTPNLVSLNSSANTTSYNLNCSGIISDPEGSNMNVTVYWQNQYSPGKNFFLYYLNNYANGTLFSSTLDKGNLTKGDLWRCRLQLSDGQIDSGLGNSNYIEILNTIPNTPTLNLVSLGPTKNTTAYDLNCSGTLIDLDGDAMNVTVQWYKNNILNLTINYNNNYVSGTLFDASLKAGNLTKNDIWKCGLRTYDSWNYSSWSNSSNLTILNQPPNSPTPLNITSLDPNYNSSYYTTCGSNPCTITDNKYDLNVSSLISDPDNDNMNVSITCMILLINITPENFFIVDYNNSYANGTLFSGIISKGNLSRDRILACLITASDGQDQKDYYLPTYILIKDLVKPNVIINSPEEIEYDTNEILFNVSAIDDYSLIDTCIFSIDSGETNYTIENNDANDWTYTLSDISNGEYTANFWCNDTAGNVNDSESVDFSVNVPENNLPDDPDPILLSSLDPAYNPFYNETCYLGGAQIPCNVATTAYDLNCSAVITDPDGDNLNVSIIWGAFNPSGDLVDYFTENYFNNYPNGTLFSAIIDKGNLTIGNISICVIFLSDGQASSPGKTMSNYILIKDLKAPNLTINSPANTSYESSGGTASIAFNVTVIDDYSNVSSCWYSINGGENNYTLDQSGDNWAYTDSSVSIGSYRANFWCNDTSNNINDSSYVDFTVSPPPNNPPDDPIVSLTSLDPNYNSTYYDPFCSETLGINCTRATTLYDFNCSALITDPDGDVMNISFMWYHVFPKPDYNESNTIELNYNNYANGTLFNTILDKGNFTNTTQGDIWFCLMRPYDGQLYSNDMGVSNYIIIKDIPPSSVTLLNPANATSTADSTPFFNWTIANDTEGDNITYNIQIDNDSDFSSPRVEKLGLTVNNYTLNSSENLSEGIYYWRVFSNDSYETNVSVVFQFEISSKAISVSLSSNLSSGIIWNVLSLPASNLSAIGNNGTGITQYDLLVYSEGVAVDIYIRANGNLITSGGNIIGLSNETFSYNSTNNTVPSVNKFKLTTNYTDNKVGTGLTNGSYVYLKFFLSAPSSQPPGTYNNTVEIKTVVSGESP
jgi:hypothetical protein